MPEFVEVQRSKPLWVVAIVGGIAVMSWAMFIQQVVRGQEIGTNPGPDWVVWLLLILGGITLPVFYVYVHLEITVNDSAVTVDYRPLTRREIPLSDIESVTARDYKPLREYGGWGVRFRENNRAYTVRGYQGVELQLKNGRQVMLGSEDADALARAISQRLP